LISRISQSLPRSLLQFIVELYHFRILRPFLIGEIFLSKTPLKLAPCLRYNIIGHLECKTLLRADL
jgi:hypothetical protein